LVGGIVYAVDELDSDDEFVGTEEDIWKGMETWMLGGHAMKFMHKGKSRDVHPIEVFQADSATMKGGYTIPKGAWYVTAKVVDDDLWEACKTRGRNHVGFSSGVAETKARGYRDR